MRKAAFPLFLLAILLAPAFAIAANEPAMQVSPGGIGGTANTVRSNFSQLAIALTAFFYLAGLGLGGFAFFKLKSHKDNPQQTPLSTPAFYIACAIGLVAVPEFMGTGLGTFFADGATVNSIGGVNTIPNTGGSW